MTGTTEVRWSIILIGRNEAANLPVTISAALRAAAPYNGEVIYSDSGSSDNSAAIAAGLGAVVVPGTPARPCASFARNAGAAVATGAYLCFVDGDIELDENFLSAAEALFSQNPDIGMVCGKLAERNPGSALVRFSDSWSSAPTGQIQVPVGGGGAISRAAFSASGGYNINLIRGEELDFGFKLKQAGYAIYALPVRFGVHDIGITGLASFLRRVAHMGKSYACVWLDKDRSYNGEFLQKAKKNIVWFGLAFFALLAVVPVTILYPIASMLASLATLLVVVGAALLKPRKNIPLFLLEKCGLIFYQMMFILLYSIKYQKNNSEDIQQLAATVMASRQMHHKQ